MTAKISVLQMNSQSNVEDNLYQAASLMQQASAEGAALVVFPEMFAVMGTDQTDKINNAENFGEGPIQTFLREQSKQHNVWIVAGTIPLFASDGQRIRAACLVYNNEGEVVARYDKIHLFDITVPEKQEHYHESKTTEPGDTLCVVDTPAGKIGLAVCYDLRFPELFRMLFQRGAEIIAIPAAFTASTGKAHWEPLLRARAIENFCYVIAANQWGVHNNTRKTHGHSMIINPWGEIIKELPKNPGVITSNIDLNKLHSIRKSMPIGEHQRIFIEY